VLIEVHAAVIGERDALGAEALLHHVGRLEVHPARERAPPVDDTVAGERERPGVRARHSVEGVADGAGAPLRPEVLGNVAVGGDAALRDARHHVPHPLEEINAGLGRSDVSSAPCFLSPVHRLLVS
jgi:hypothetical protein